MKYIIMCGGNYTKFKTPKHLTQVYDEPLVVRTIRLLKEAGVTDISISSENPIFDVIGVPVLRHKNAWEVTPSGSTGDWYDCFYPTNEPTCYILGDVVFSSEAIRTIVSTETDDIEFFASAPPFDKKYTKPYAEPFAFKVANLDHFRTSLNNLRELDRQGVFRRNPIAWELWQVIKGTPLNKIDYTNYTVINDYTCDIDDPKDVEKIMQNMDIQDVPKDYQHSEPSYLIHAMPKRMWYVEEYLIPSMLEQGIDKSQISVYNDDKGEGNLKACMNAFLSVGDTGGTWHLQDDVCICKDFKERTEWYNSGLVCGFSSKMYDGSAESKKGAVSRENMWFSFPCIRIPNEWAKECAHWVFEYIIGNPVYEKYWKKGVNDDWMFRAYLKEFHKNCTALNIMPNLVDHIDHLIGGGTGASKRKEPCRAQYWADPEIVERLEESINGR